MLKTLPAVNFLQPNISRILEVAILANAIDFEVKVNIRHLPELYKDLGIWPKILFPSLKQHKGILTPDEYAKVREIVVTDTKPCTIYSEYIAEPELYNSKRKQPTWDDSLQYIMDAIEFKQANQLDLDSVKMENLNSVCCNLLKTAYDRLNLSTDVMDSIVKLGFVVSLLNKHTEIKAEDVAEAIQYHCHKPTREIEIDRDGPEVAAIRTILDCMFMDEGIHYGNMVSAANTLPAGPDRKEALEHVEKHIYKHLLVLQKMIGYEPK